MVKSSLLRYMKQYSIHSKRKPWYTGSWNIAKVSAKHQSINHSKNNAHRKLNLRIFFTKLLSDLIASNLKGPTFKIRTNTVLVIGLHELLRNPTTKLIVPPGLLVYTRNQWLIVKKVMFSNYFITHLIEIKLQLIKPTYTICLHVNNWLNTWKPIENWNMMLINNSL